jgi:hypothetical protein
MNAWNHLPNAHHIDRVLESVKSHPEIWDATWDKARGAASDAALSASRGAAWDAAWNAALSASRGAAWNAAWNAAMNAAWVTAAALIAYDDASKYLDMPSDQLRVWAILSEDPAAVLLLPAVVAFERISELECV